MQKDLWQRIGAALESDIMHGVLEPGSQLPTEIQLAEQFGTGRHSVRRAVAELSKKGLLSIEQGRGTFVQARPRLEYTIGKRTRLRRNLAAQATDIVSQKLGTERISAPQNVSDGLRISAETEVIASRRLTLADGMPVSFGTIYHDAARFGGYPERREALGSVSAVYASYGIQDYVRASTQIHARQARPEEARHLRQHADMPVVVVTAVDAELDGTPLSYSVVIWSSARVRFSIDTSEGET